MSEATLTQANRLPIWIFAICSAAGIAAFSVVDTLYFTSAGFSLQQIGLFTAAYSLSSAIAEFPSAVLFDRWSNKWAIQLGNIVRTIAFLIFFLATTQGTVILAEIVAGIGAAAMSGTLQALLMNSVGNDDRFSMLTKFTVLSSAGGLAGGMVGVAVFAVSPRWIWIVAILFFIIAGAGMIFAADDRKSVERLPLGAFTRSAFSVLRNRGCWVLALINCAVVIPLMLWQLRVGGSVSLGPVLFAFVLMKVAAFTGPLLARRFHVSEQHFPWALVINCLALVGFAFFQSTILVAACFFLHVLCHVLMSVMMSSVFHSELSSSTRATAGSIETLLETGLIAIVAPIAGAIAGGPAGLATAVMLAIGIYLVALILDQTWLHSKKSTT